MSQIDWKSKFAIAITLVISNAVLAIAQSQQTPPLGESNPPTEHQADATQLPDPPPPQSHEPPQMDDQVETKPKEQSSARIILDRQHIQSHLSTPGPSFETSRYLAPTHQLRGTSTQNLNSFSTGALFDSHVSPAAWQVPMDSQQLPRIIHGPPPPVARDPAFNSPSGEQIDQVLSATTRQSRHVPVRIPTFFEVELTESSPSQTTTNDPFNSFAEWPGSQDSNAEEIELSRVPAPPGYRLKLSDESGQAFSPNRTSAPPDPLQFLNSHQPSKSLHQPLDSPWSQTDSRSTCDLNCTIPCSPLFYSFLWGGSQSLRDMRTWSPDPFDPRAIYEFDLGVAAGVGIGIYHGPNWRADLELAFRSNSLDSIDFLRTIGSPTQETFLLDGHLKSYAGMSNFYWDFPQFPMRSIKPYIGFGVGFVFLDPDVHLVGRRILDPRYDRDSSFAYQWMAGLNAQLNEQFDLFCEYRFFAADSFHLNADIQSISGRLGDPSSLWGDLDYRTQNIILGLRLKF